MDIREQLEAEFDADTVNRIMEIICDYLELEEAPDEG